MPLQAINESVVSGVKKFLDALNSSGGTPIEQLSPRDARQVLTDAQNSVQVDLSGIEKSEKTIDFDGKELKLVLWDEFDSRGFHRLQYLLAPMQDGRFQDGALTHAVGRCFG
jgi:hypothetical protein